jgi:hypothetical protein
VGQPSTVDSLLETALAGGAKTLKPAKKGLSGYGAIVQDADQVIWKLATNAKKDKGPATREIEDLVLLIGATDLGATKRFYVERGLPVKRSFPGRYVESRSAATDVSLARFALAQRPGYWAFAARGKTAERVATHSSAAGAMAPRKSSSAIAAMPRPGSRWVKGTYWSRVRP